MPHKILQVPEYGMLEAYAAQLQARAYQPDAAQQAAAQRLQQMYSELLAFKAARRTRLRKWLARPRQPGSVYLWGGVGRGKTFLMGCFFDALPYQRKRRVHFHAFMQEVHGLLRKHKDSADPLQNAASDIAAATRLLCFDEFHVSDIADAMILGRLLEALFARGVIFVMTSNYPPDGLYPNGLQRINFLPTIEMIKQRFDVLEVDGGTDYRLLTLQSIETYLTPDGPAAQQKMNDDFVRLSAQEPKPGKIEILDRELSFLGRAAGVIWFDFASLCEGPRSQNDYLEIAREHHSLLLSGVPQMGEKDASQARRLTWLIDILYDHRVKLIASAAVPTHKLYTEGLHAQEFVRIASRLIEMRSTQYLAEAHHLEAEIAAKE